jgi:hypothetical protein
MINYNQDKEKEIEEMTKLMNGKECIAVVIGKLTLEEMVAFCNIQFVFDDMEKTPENYYYDELSVCYE